MAILFMGICALFIKSFYYYSVDLILLHTSYREWRYGWMSNEYIKVVFVLGVSNYYVLAFNLKCLEQSTYFADVVNRKIIWLVIY